MVVVLVGSAVPVGTPASWEGREVHFVFFFFGFSAFFSAAREFKENSFILISISF